MSENTFTPDRALDELCVQTIRMLAVDAVEAARSGHPGAPMGAADVAYVLWSRFLRFDPTDPSWPDRDRFVLSVGHASMLQYALLHLSGYDLTLDELKRFRQWGSRAAGHPEHGFCPGVETTTGPLGQGFAHGVGMALASRMLAARFPGDGFRPVDHRVFALCGDGDLMEGITYEAASLAGHLGLGNLVYLYDSNRITIEGNTNIAFTEDVTRRFEAAGWHVLSVDGYDHEAVAGAIQAGIDETAHPTLVICHTEIARGAPTLHGSAKTHGSPLGPDEVRRTKEAAGWPLEPTFIVPDAVRARFAGIAGKGRAQHASWEAGMDAWRAAHPDLAASWDAHRSGAAPADLADRLLAAAMEVQGKATRAVGNRVLQAAWATLPNLVGGSADLGPSNETNLAAAAHVLPGDAGTFAGSNLHFGIREHAMGAALNGLALSGAFRPYGATFLVFSDYLKPAIRLAALMELPSVFVFTHDSYAVGEDGPTHQPIEHLWMLRSIPNLNVWRPADAIEVAAAYTDAFTRRDGPTAVVLTRQALAPFDRLSGSGMADALSGGYVVREPTGRPSFAIVATGSEVRLALDAAALLERRGLSARVVSVPCVERFEALPADVRERILPRDLKVVTVEAGSTVGWGHWAGRDGLCIGRDEFGASAPAEVLAREFGFTPEAVASKIAAWAGLHD